MKSTNRILFWINLIACCFTLAQVYDLLTQLNDSRLNRWLVTREEINSVDVHSKTEYQIPAIIHQTYKTEDIPSQWDETRQTIHSTNPNYEYKFWTDEAARNFIAENYTWFLDTYDSYKYPIMRVDAFRYFALFHYGGFYIDLDIGLRGSLDPLRKFPTVLYKTEPVGISNDFMASSPGHPFMLRALQSLKQYNRNWFISYLTVMYSTGPLFLSIILQKYNWWRTRLNGVDSTRIYLMNALKDSVHQPLGDYIFHVHGSSWHKNDASLFVTINSNKILASIIIPILAVALTTVVIFIEIKIINGIKSFLWYRRGFKSSYKWKV